MKNLRLLFILLLTPLSLFSQDDNNNNEEKNQKKEFGLPKGAAYVIPNFNFNQNNGLNTQYLGVKFDSKEDMKYSINLNGGYFIKRDFAIGLQVGFSNKQHDYTYYPNGLKTTSMSYANLVSLYPNIRNYFGKGIVKGFIQTNLGFSFGNGLTRTYAEANDTKVDIDSYLFTVSIQPGIALFVADFVSVELAINLIGYTAEWDYFTNSDGSESQMTSNDISFDVNLLTMSIGIGFYIDSGSGK